MALHSTLVTQPSRHGNDGITTKDPTRITISGRRRGVAESIRWRLSQRLNMKGRGIEWLMRRWAWPGWNWKGRGNGPVPYLQERTKAECNFTLGRSHVAPVSSRIKTKWRCSNYERCKRLLLLAVIVVYRFINLRKPIDTGARVNVSDLRQETDWPQR